MRECYTSKVFSKPPCLIAKIKLEKSVHLEKLKTRQHARGRFDPERVVMFIVSLTVQILSILFLQSNMEAWRKF